MVGGMDLMKLFQQAGQIQERVNSEQGRMAEKQYDAEAGAGMVKVTVNGLQDVMAIHVEESALKDLGLEAVLELVVAATNLAISKAREASKSEMMGLFQQMAGGMMGGEDEK